MSSVTTERRAPVDGALWWQRLERLRAQIRAHGVTPVRPRLLAQIIRLYGERKGVGIDAPHSDSYLIPLTDLRRLLDQQGYLLELEGASDPAILIAEPGPDELTRCSDAQLLWRAEALEYHARLHLRLRPLEAEGVLDAAGLDRFEAAIGSRALTEAMRALESERRFLRPRTRCSEVMELITQLLEVNWYHPHLLPFWFPTLPVERALAAIDRIAPLDPVEVLGRPRRAAPPPRQLSSPWRRVELPIRPPAERGRLYRLMRRADRHRRKGNLVRAVLLSRRAWAVTWQPDQRETLTRHIEGDLAALSQRLYTAMEQRGPHPHRWQRALRPLAAGRLGFWPRALRCLYDLQKAATDFERRGFLYQPLVWLRSGGSAPIRRPLDNQVLVRIHRRLRTATAHALKARLTAEERLELIDVLRSAREVVRASLRQRYRPILAETLEEVGLTARSLPEQVAASKIVEGLLDRVIERDYLQMSDLRDEISQSSLKMDDLTRLDVLLFGDVLLRANRALSQRMPGVWRPTPIYLRLLQRASSLAFGTRLGRLATRFAGIPLIGAYVALEGSGFVLHHVLELVGSEAHPDLTRSWTIAPLALFILLMLERPRARRAVLRALQGLGTALATLLWHWPVALWTHPWVRQVFDSHLFILTRRYVLRPIVFAALLVSALPGLRLSREQALASGAILSVALSAVTNSRLGRRISAAVGDRVAIGWATLRHRLLPNLFRFVMDTSRQFIGLLERASYAVDETLRFRRGDPRLALTGKLLGGAAWSVVMYVVQLYVVLLIEPQLNPIKHFPVVTVSHKLILPASGQLLGLIQPPLSNLLGPVIGTTIATTTIFLLPGFFGFLVWEFSANWRIYQASRPSRLSAVPIGSHGETLAGLLRPGFHTGAVPRAFRQLRRRAIAADRRGEPPSESRADLTLHHAEDAVRRFFERELVAFLDRTEQGPPPLVLGGVECGLHTIRVELLVAGHPELDPLELIFEERDGVLWAWIEPGFAPELDHIAQVQLSDALLGTLVMAEVRQVRVVDQPGRGFAMRERPLRWADWQERWQEAAVDAGLYPTLWAPTKSALVPASSS